MQIARSGRCLKLVAVVLFAFTQILLAKAEQPADVIVIHARIYSLNSQQAWAEALAVRDGKIVAVGKDREMAAFRGPATKQIDAGGRLVLPGFTDCHVHFMDGSMGLTQVDLNGANSAAEIQKRVKEYAAAHPKDAWITGMGWTYPTFAPSGLPDKKILDEVVPNRPVYLVAFDGHSSWANSKALELAGIGRDTADPANGAIVRDASGQPTGALKEAAGELVAKLMPKPTRAERLAALRKGIRNANQLGIVRVHSAGQDFEYFDLYDELRRNGQLTVRFYISYFLDPPGLTPQIVETIEKARTEYNDDWLAGGVVKTMLDGVVEAHTAAMLEPYSDDATQSGKLFWDEAKYKETVRELDRRGFQIFTHAIGDRAVRLALDAYQDAAAANQTHDARPRIEHIETISAADIARFGKLGVIASMQPLHANPDEDTLGVWARNVGPERAQRAWVWRSIEQAGGTVAFGSDWPVVTINPWLGIGVAVTRQTEEGTPVAAFLPQQRLSVEQAIRGYTLGAAFAGRREKTEGSLEPGKLADLIVLSQDLFKVEPSEIPKTKVLLTMVGGKVVYKASNWPAGSPAAENH